MCGICGFVAAPGRASTEAVRGIVEKLTGALWHRGPDDGGLLEEVAAGMALGQRRLSILDLSPAGHQPMVSHSGRSVIVFNGEVYNFAEIRQELESSGAIAWRGHSDTEIVLEAIERWGIDAALDRMNGMFALAWWDRKEQRLCLARDRIGKKPLYYGWLDNGFVFASEARAIRAALPSQTGLNRAAIPLLLKMNYIPSPQSILRGIFKLPPSCVLTLPLARLRDRGAFSPYSRGPARGLAGVVYEYWSLQQVLEEGEEHHGGKTEGELLAELDGLLRDATRLRMIADVPLGAFLSGGIDSSTVVALMQAQSSRPVKTFSIGYHEPGNEAEFAKAIAGHLGTDHTELYVSPGEAAEWVPRMAEISDEPMGDTAVVPTYLVARLARQAVTVTLAGDGGDELFAGYPRYLWAAERWLPFQERAGAVPVRARRVCGRLLRALPASLPTPRLHDAGKMLALETPEQVYRSRVFHCAEPADLVLDVEEPSSVITRPPRLRLKDPIQRMVYLDLASRLGDQIVSKVDRATMQVHLEARCPILDRRVIEFSARIPMAMKIQNGAGKKILRKLLYQYVPESLVNRPKTGFKMPICEWLRGPFKDWAEALLAPERLRRDGVFKVEPVRALWREHATGAADRHYLLWDILMVQAWIDAHGM